MMVSFPISAVMYLLGVLVMINVASACFICGIRELQIIRCGVGPYEDCPREHYYVILVAVPRVAHDNFFRMVFLLLIFIMLLHLKLCYISLQRKKAMVYMYYQYIVGFMLMGAFFSWNYIFFLLEITIWNKMRIIYSRIEFFFF